MSLPVELGVDQLWKYQLRREHTALLQGLEDQKNKYAAYAEELKVAHESLQDQINTMKSKLNKLTVEGERHTQEIEDDLGAVNEKCTEIAKLRDELKTLGARVDIIEISAQNTTTGELQISAPVACMVKELPRVSTEALIQQPIPLSVETSSSASLKPTSTSARRRNSRLPTGNKSVKKSQNKANTGLRKSRRQAHRDPSPIPTLTYTPLPEYPLEQDKMPLDAFVHQIDEICAAIAPENRRELAGMFITGLARREEQDAMVAVLSNKLMAKVYGDGRVEIYSEWKDMRRVLLEAGLIVEVEEADMPKRRGKK